MPRQHKILQEPAGSGAVRNGPLARVRAVARAFGDAWPHLPEQWPVDVGDGLEVHEEIMPAAGTPLAVLHFLARPHSRTG